ncbi:MAG: protein kinase, partial [Cyanobacteria bacterium J06632_22]
MLSLPGYQSTQLIYESERTQIFRALQQATQRPVILKMPQQAYPTSSELVRYRREYALLLKLKSTQVIQTYGLEWYQNRLVLVLEDCQGISLKQRLAAEGSLSLTESLAIGVQLVEQLQALHHHGIVHKDINPANILIVPRSGQVRLIDFGMATEFSSEGTSTKTLEGTLSYLSPEQTGRTRHSIDYRTDFYALGVTLYELLTQQLPFASEDTLELVHAHLAKFPQPPSERQADLPSIVSDLVMKLLAKAPDHRYQSAWGLKHDLQQCLTAWKSHGQIAHFDLARQDIPQRFALSQTLYGREAALEQLQQGLQQSRLGPTQLALIAGSSGMGKSALIQGIQPWLWEQQAVLLSGKFEQLPQQAVPYGALSTALSHWVNQRLTLPEAAFQTWRDSILTAVGDNGQLMVDLV